MYRVIMKSTVYIAERGTTRTKNLRLEEAFTKLREWLENRVLQRKSTEKTTFQAN